VTKRTEREDRSSPTEGTKQDDMNSLFSHIIGVGSRHSKELNAVVSSLTKMTSFDNRTCLDETFTENQSIFRILNVFQLPFFLAAVSRCSPNRALWKVSVRVFFSIYTHTLQDHRTTLSDLE